MARGQFQHERPNGTFRCTNCGQAFASQDELAEHEVVCRPGSGRGSQLPRRASEWQEQPEQSL